MSEEYNAEIYSTSEWFESLAWQHHWIEKMAGWWAGEFGRPKRVCDFGAGDAWWCKAFAELEADTWAVELSEAAGAFVPEQVQLVYHDLRSPLELGFTFDLTICIEVAEHLPPTCAKALCRTLGLHSTHLLMFSAAGPGQEGTGHINLKTQEYWREELGLWGLRYDIDRTAKAVRAFRNIVNHLFEFLPQNLQVFVHG